MLARLILAVVVLLLAWHEHRKASAPRAIAKVQKNGALSVDQLASSIDAANTKVTPLTEDETAKVLTDYRMRDRGGDKSRRKTS